MVVEIRVSLKGSGISLGILLENLPRIPFAIASGIVVRIAPGFYSWFFVGVALGNPEGILIVFLFCITSGIQAGIPSKIPSLFP